VVMIGVRRGAAESPAGGNLLTDRVRISSPGGQVRAQR